MKIIVASQNPVKIKAAENGFSSFFENFEIKGVEVPSEVADQPMTDQETLLGAKNRAQNARNNFSDANYFVGIEGGIENNGDAIEAFAWVVILGKHKIGKSRTTSFEIPQKVTALIKEGHELGHANDVVFDKSNSKQKGGAVGLLTNGVISRTKLYEQAVILALIPFINENLY